MRLGLVRLDGLAILEGLVTREGDVGWAEGGVEERGLCIVAVEGEVMSGSGRW